MLVRSWRLSEILAGSAFPRITNQENGEAKSGGGRNGNKTGNRGGNGKTQKMEPIRE